MMNRTCLTGVLIIVFLSVVAQDSYCQSDGSEGGQEQASINRIDEILSSEISMSYDDTPFIDIMDEIRSNYAINVLLDQSAINDSLRSNDLVTLQVRQIPFKTALSIMLENFNATYVIQDDVLRVISKDAAKNREFLVRKIINCNLLLEKIRVAGRVGEYDGNKAETQLLDAIRVSVTPDDWIGANGNASVVVVGNCLLIHHTEQAIQKIEVLLKQLSRAIDQ